MLVNRPKKIIAFELSIRTIQGIYDPNNDEMRLYLKLGDILPATIDEVTSVLETLRPLEEEPPKKNKKVKIVFKKPD